MCVTHYNWHWNRRRRPLNWRPDPAPKTVIQSPHWVTVFVVRHDSPEGNTACALSSTSPQVERQLVRPVGDPRLGAEAECGVGVADTGGRVQRVDRTALVRIGRR